MSYSQRRADRIREQVPLLEVMLTLGYNLNPNGGDREQQYHCNLHGTGRDSKPSARFYAATNSTYCFACGKSRDALSLVQDHNSWNFAQAAHWLEQQFHLAPLSFEPEAPKETFETSLFKILQPVEDVHALQRRVRALLDSQVTDRTLELPEYLDWWAKLDKLDWQVSLAEGKAQALTPAAYASALQELFTELKGALREAAKRTQNQGQ